MKLRQFRPGGAVASRSVESVGYNVSQAARIVGVSRRQLDYWAETDLIAPSVVPAGKTRRLYSFFELIELRTLARLREEGQISLQRMRRVLAELEKVRDRPLATCRLVAAEGNVFLLDDDEDGLTITEVMDRWQMVTAVSLHGLEYEVRRELGRIGLAAPPPLLGKKPQQRLHAEAV